MAHVINLDTFRSKFKAEAREKDATLKLQSFYTLALAVDYCYDLARLPVSFGYITISHDGAQEIQERIRFLQRLLIDGESYLDHMVYRDFFLNLAPECTEEDDPESCEIIEHLIETDSNAMELPSGWFANREREPSRAEMVICAQGAHWRSHEAAVGHTPPQMLSSRPLPLALFEHIAEETNQQ